MILHVCVILFKGGRSASVHAEVPPTPQEQTPPWDQAPLPDQAPPRSRPPWNQAPPGTRHPPRAEHAGRYGQRADGTHPTGMQSSYAENSLSILPRYQVDTTFNNLHETHKALCLKVTATVHSAHTKVKAVQSRGHCLLDNPMLLRSGTSIKQQLID